MYYAYTCDAILHFRYGLLQKYFCVNNFLQCSEISEQNPSSMLTYVMKNVYAQHCICITHRNN